MRPLRFSVIVAAMGIKPPPYLLLWSARLAIALSPFPLVLTLFFAVAKEIITVYALFSCALLVFGLGGIINHSAIRPNHYVKKTIAPQHPRQQQQAPCTLGNLLIIIAILLGCMALGKLFAL